MTEILHTIIDVLAGRRNLPAHEADALHEQLTPGYTIPAPSEAEMAAAQATLARAAAQSAPAADLAADLAADPAAPPAVAS